MNVILSSQAETITIGLGELQVTRNKFAVLACLGLGSCVGVCIYDPALKVGGMAHIVLPSGEGRNDNGAPAKYADTGVPALLEEMKKIGALRSRMIIKLAGGAALSKAPGLENVFKIGEKNLAAIQEILSREHLNITAADIGGGQGRTVRMYLDSGKVIVTTAGNITKEL